MKKVIVLLFLLSSPGASLATEVQGSIEEFSISASTVSIVMDNVLYQTDSDFMKYALSFAYTHNQDVVLDYVNDSGSNIIQYIYVTSPYTYGAKIVSLFIGAVSASAFAIGLGIKLS